MADLRPSLDPFFRDFGVAATVTPPGGAAVATTVILHDRGVLFPSAGNLSVNEARRTVSLRRDQVPTLKSGTTITTATESLTVEGIVQQDDQRIEAIVR